MSVGEFIKECFEILSQVKNDRLDIFFDDLEQEIKAIDKFENKEAVLKFITELKNVTKLQRKAFN